MQRGFTGTLSPGTITPISLQTTSEQVPLKQQHLRSRLSPTYQHDSTNRNRPDTMSSVCTNKDVSIQCPRYIRGSSHAPDASAAVTPR